MLMLTAIRVAARISASTQARFPGEQDHDNRVLCGRPRPFQRIAIANGQMGNQTPDWTAVANPNILHISM